MEFLVFKDIEKFVAQASRELEEAELAMRPREPSLLGIGPFSDVLRYQDSAIVQLVTTCDDISAARSGSAGGLAKGLGNLDEVAQRRRGIAAMWGSRRGTTGAA